MMNLKLLLAEIGSNLYVGGIMRQGDDFSVSCLFCLSFSGLKHVLQNVLLKITIKNIENAGNSKNAGQFYDTS